VIQSTASQDDHDEDPSSGADNCGDQEDSTPEATGNQSSLLTDATCTPADIRYPTDLSLLNAARDVTEKLIDAIHPPVSDGFGAKLRTHRRKARQQFPAVAMKKRPRINKIRKAIKQQLAHLERNLTSIDALIACGASFMAAGRHWYIKLLVVSELVRQQ
jgi:IS5 family transposase